MMGVPIIFSISRSTGAYLYDSLGRLSSSATTATTGWGLNFTYDGFGNKTGQTAKPEWTGNGTVPQPSFTVDAATNRLTAFGHDANGNVISGLAGLPGLYTYDVENRLVDNGVEQYGYGAWNQRLWKKVGTDTYQVYLYGLRGELLEVYQTQKYAVGQWGFGRLAETQRAYFGGRLVRVGQEYLGWSKVTADRLGSYMKTYPYGEPQGTAEAGGEKFATYWRDGTGLDYALNRYYSSQMGRFLTADPYRASGGPANPASWNRYAYVEGDPVNYFDPAGLQAASPIFYWECWESSGPYGYSCAQRVQMSWDGGVPSGGSSGIPLEQDDTIRVKGLSTTSVHAVGVQNSLRWIRAALEQDADCSGWLNGNSQVIATLLGEGTGMSVVYAGVGEFSTTTVSAVAGVGGTDMADGAALLTVNTKGAFFNSDFLTDSGRMKGGTDEAKAFILLHELAHLTEAASFKSGDRVVAIQKANNDLLHEHCQKTLNRAGGRIP